MPLTRNGVTFADAYLEAASVAPVGRAMLDALELYPPDGRAPLRFVNDYVPLFATLEATATTDAGLEVEWLACPCRIKPAEESDTADSPEVTIEIDNLNGAISDILRETRGILVPWVLVNRKYASDNTAAPAQLPPLSVELASVTCEGDVASLTCAFGDAGNFGVPGLTFQRTQYPGLVR